MIKATAYKGDTLEIMDTLIASGIKVDAIITDPPYQKTNQSWDIIIPAEEMWKRLKKISRNNRTPIVLFGNEPFSSIIRMSNFKMYKYDWIWEKNKVSNFLNAKKQPMRAFENIMVFYKKQCLYNPQKTKGHPRKVSTAKHKRNSTIGNIHNHYEANTTYDSTERYPRNIIKFNTVNQDNKLHPNQKPVKLLEYLIKTYTNEGDVILDFTAGSMSTGEAAINISRNVILIEKDEVFFNRGVNRLKNIDKNFELIIK